MEDKQIVDLFWERSETAISETQAKYGSHCYKVAYHILYSNEDTEECVNDTYLRAWNAMPPHRPERLSAFLGRITRNLALDRYERKRAQKRFNATEVVLDELAECVPDPGTMPPSCEELHLQHAVNGFLASLPKRTRIIFMRRYWYLCSIVEIAKDSGLSESNIKVILLRTRQKFRAYLEKEGIVL